MGTVVEAAVPRETVQIVHFFVKHGVPLAIHDNNVHMEAFFKLLELKYIVHPVSIGRKNIGDFNDRLAVVFCNRYLMRIEATG